MAACAGVSVGALVVALAPGAKRFALAAAVLAKLSGAPLPAAWERWLLDDISEQQLQLPTPAGAVRARRYAPRTAGTAAAPAPALLLLHGVHYLGIAEPRLIALARALAQAGMDVLTPELTPLTRYELDPSLVQDIQQIAAAWAHRTHSPAVGVIGISFAGGLALMAAAQQAGPRPIGFVTSVGGHADLLRVCAFYAGHDVRGPDHEPAAVAPHPYGARVMLREQLASLVSPGDLPQARAALDSYLHDRPRAARRLATRLSPEGQAVMRVLLDSGGSATLSAWLMDVARARRQQLRAASPHGRLAGLRVPVLLLHGAGDPVIPSIETSYLAREVPARALRAALITPLLRHAEFPARPALGPALRLVDFMQRLLRVAGGMAAGSAARAR